MKVSCFKLVIWITLFMGQSSSICFRFSAFYWDSEDSIESRSGGAMTENYASLGRHTPNSNIHQAHASAYRVSWQHSTCYFSLI